MSRVLQARENFVIIKGDPIKEVSKAGIILSEVRQQETDCMGTVVSVGPGTYQMYEGKPVLMPTNIKIGDRVLFTPMGCQLIHYQVEPETLEMVDDKEVKKGGVEDFYVTQQHNIVAYVDFPL